MEDMENEIRALVESGLTLEQVMERTGLKKIAILRWCGEHALLARLHFNGSAPRKAKAKAAAKPKKIDTALLEMVAAGKRPKQIAIEWGVSRQAVHQRLKKAGLILPRTPTKRGPHKTEAKYGLPMDSIKALRANGAVRAFQSQRKSAFYRGIGWEMNLAQWWGVWDASGMWEKRGLGKGCYEMARRGDLGPYAVGNVYICTHRENVMERELHSPSTFGRLKNRQEQASQM